MELSVVKAPDNSLAFTNCVYVNAAQFAQLAEGSTTPAAEIAAHGLPCYVKDFIYQVRGDERVPAGQIAPNGYQRREANLALSDRVMVQRVTDASAAPPLSVLHIQADLLRQSAEKVQLDCDELTESFKSQFQSHVFRPGGQIAFNFPGHPLSCTVSKLEHVDLDGNQDGAANGQLLGQTTIQWSKPSGSQIKLSGQRAGGGSQIFQRNFDFEALGIGGLDAEFGTIFRRAFASRMYPSHIMEQMGIHHVRGMLLYGPPGCGKTLIARQIGQVLRAREPKIVSGPSILDKYVGGAEENIRALFEDAEKEQEEMGDDSELHIVILDELDAICKKRGSGGPGAGGQVLDSVVNQLLAKIDGVDSLNNILLIGMTNRKNAIDDALLRPGRLEVHVEIGLPNEEGRMQIIQIHTANMRQHNRMTDEAVENMPVLAARTKNFTGAELQGLTNAASSHALNRCIDRTDMSKTSDMENVLIQWGDFEHALTEITPKFGTDEQVLETYYRNGIVPYGPVFDDISTTLNRLINQVRTSDRTPLLTCLLEGPIGTGKTALATSFAQRSNLPFVRLISADSLIGMHETAKCAHILGVFQDSYKSPQSIIILDDIERILDYTPLGPRFSNVVLQTLLVLLKKIPDTGKAEGREQPRLMVIGTTSMASQLEDLQLISAFNVVTHVPNLSSPDEYKTVLGECPGLGMSQSSIDEIASSISDPIALKKLLMFAEMARDDSGTVTCERFLECLHAVGY